ncbi:hypothetical protein OL229_09215 [Neisseriaceae bacterium JH1-16]|nr:hypothetical protein [Neisseriaceae bacterium JH1-16]
MNQVELQGVVEQPKDIPIEVRLGLTFNGIRSVSGALDFGVEYPPESGKLHFDYELRLPMVGDNIAAIEEHGVASNLRINTAMIARCLTRLGNVPAKDIGYELLDAALVDEDFDVLTLAQGALKKKRMASSPNLPTSASPSLLSASTASPSLASAS